VFQRTYGIECVGLRYFNVFGRRQDPDGPYAAVIPRWIRQILNDEECEIFGDGETSRDFCYVDNVVQANLCAACAASDATGQVYNIAFGERTTLRALFEMIRDRLVPSHPHAATVTPVYRAFRQGDLRHSLADISRARSALGYRPSHSVANGLDEALHWYLADWRRAQTVSVEV
jgi:UDP-N-acetylglucosamine/UDP-N-acetylgalactosamine 4-epimerase